jgi:hypothetical protein
VQELGADVLLEEGNGPADGGRRPPEPTPGACKAAFIQGGDEHFHRFDTIHAQSSGRGTPNAYDQLFWCFGQMS